MKKIRLTFFISAILASSFLLTACDVHRHGAIDTSAAGKRAQELKKRLEAQSGLQFDESKVEQRSTGGMGKKVTAVKKEVTTNQKGVVIIKENTVINLTGSKYTDAETGISVGPLDVQFTNGEPDIPY